MTSMHNFSNRKKSAINEMFEMNKRATKTEEKPQQNKTKCDKMRIEKQGVSFNADELLVLGLVLILSKDCDDTMLFLALLYILM